MPKPLAKKVAPVPKINMLRELQKLDADQTKLAAARAKLVEGAKLELITRGQELIDQFAALGLRYELVDRARRPVGKKSHHAQVKGKGMRQKAPGKACPLCKWSTKPPHDRRAHRWQEPKAPFSAAELAERGLTRV